MHTSALPIPAEQWALYQQAVVDIHFATRTQRVAPCAPGTTRGLFPVRSRETIHVLTAFNPAGRTVSPEDNERAHNVLLRELNRRSVTWWRATGGDPYGTHTEKSAAVIGLTEADAREIGQRFGQDAVFAWTPRTWRLLSCVSDQVQESGWRTSEQR